MQGIAIRFIGGAIGGDVEFHVAANVRAAGLGHVAAVELDGEGSGGVDGVVGACVAV